MILHDIEHLHNNTVDILAYTNSLPDIRLGYATVIEWRCVTFVEYLLYQLPFFVRIRGEVNPQK